MVWSSGGFSIGLHPLRLDPETEAARTLAAQAERDLATLVSQRQKVRADYLAGKLPAETFAALDVDLDEHEGAARAEAERLAAQAEMASDRPGSRRRWRSA